MKRLWLTAPLILSLTGCGESDIDIVKNGVMDFNKTITIGNALDNWKSCESSKWDSFQTDNGIKVVEFSCKHKISSFMDKMKELSSERNRNSGAFNVTTNTQTFQFTLNQDSTFQIDNVQVKNTWADGTSFEDSQRPVQSLQAAYANELNFDASILNKTTAAQMAYVFAGIKARAN